MENINLNKILKREEKVQYVKDILTTFEANKNNPMWNAGAMSQQFGNFINQRFPLSRKNIVSNLDFFLK